MVLFRRIVFYLFTLIYIVVCPLTIFYALGFIYKPGSELGMVKTGLIYLASVPPKASVYFDQSRFARKTPVMIRDLLPGNYHVSIRRRGYKPWAQTIPVEAEKASALDKILLVSDPLKTQKVAAGPFETLIPLAGTHYFLLARGRSLADVFVYNLRQEKIRPLIRTDFPSAGERVLSWFSVKHSDHLLVNLKEDPLTSKFYWFDLDSKEDPVDLTLSFSAVPSRVEWDPKDEEHLFAFREGTLHEVRTDRGSAMPKFSEDVRGLGLFNRTLYVLTPQNQLVRENFEHKDRRVILRDAAFVRALFGEKAFFEINILAQDLLLFRGEKGELLANRLPYRFAEGGVEGFEFYKKLERVLVWRKDRIGILDFSKSKPRDDVFEKGPRLVWVYKEGKAIQQGFWVYDGTHILFRDQDTVFLLDMETYGRPELHRLVDIKKDTPVSYSEDSGMLYYLEPSHGDLMAAEILPKREILSLSFPVGEEKTVEREMIET